MGWNKTNKIIEKSSAFKILSTGSDFFFAGILFQNNIKYLQDPMRRKFIRSIGSECATEYLYLSKLFFGIYNSQIIFGEKFPLSAFWKEI